MSQLSDATLMALTAHEGQYRRDSKPYVIHPLAVAFALIARVGERAAVVGLLHDVIEDRPKEATIIDNVLLFRHLSVTLDAEQCAR
jgi:(p)ppGpp synthase/HD superfamily hydrolase